MYILTGGLLRHIGDLFDPITQHIGVITGESLYNLLGTGLEEMTFDPEDFGDFGSSEWQDFLEHEYYRRHQYDITVIFNNLSKMKMLLLSLESMLILHFIFNQLIMAVV